MRVAVAQLAGSEEVPTAERLAATGAAVRDAMRDAHRQGARLVLFHEGALTYPHKTKISATPGEVDNADWALADWPALRAELDAVRHLARELRIWTVVHAPHRLSDGNRPHNSLYVLSDDGAIVTRYDKRLLSHTEVVYLYTPGTEPIVFDVDGVRFGCALCIEIQFPEVFTEYAALGVDCVLFSSSYGSDFPRLAQAHASLNALTIAVAMGQPSGDGVSGVAGPDGRWLAQCHRTVPDVAVADLENVLTDASRTWRAIARSGSLHEPARRPDDPRSTDRTAI